VDSQHSGLEDGETSVLMVQCRRFLRYLLKNETDAPDVPLLYVQAGGEPGSLKALGEFARQLGADLVINEDRLVTLVSHGERFTKYSPMAARLAFLGSTHACVDADLAGHLSALTERLTPQHI
jgi:hypothetical protein